MIPMKDLFRSPGWHFTVHRSRVLNNLFYRRYFRQLNKWPSTGSGVCCGNLSWNNSFARDLQHFFMHQVVNLVHIISLWRTGLFEKYIAYTIWMKWLSIVCGQQLNDVYCKYTECTWYKWTIDTIKPPKRHLIKWQACQIWLTGGINWGDEKQSLNPALVTSKAETLIYECVQE